VIASGIQEAAGVFHAHPIICVLPDDPALGESRAAFAGRFGILEELFRPARGAGFAARGSTEISSTRDLLDSLRSSPANQVDSRAFLAARLVDFMLGDFDDGAGAWEWVRFGDSSESTWRPISPDANRRLTKPRGLIPIPFRRAERSVPDERTFEALDRELLADLDGAIWDSVITSVQAKLSDTAIVRAVNAMPEEMRPASSAALLKALEARRTQLARFARSYYRRLSEAADIRTTGVPELAVIDRLDNRRMEVVLWELDTNGRPVTGPYFRRRLDRLETEEVRLHLRGSGDRVVVRGDGRDGIVLRILREGLGGELIDSSRAGDTRLYDSGKVVHIAGTNRVALDSRSYEAATMPSQRWSRPSPDYGRRAGLSSWGGVGSWSGLFLGEQYTVERFGFRQPQFASRTTLRAGYSPRLGEYEVDVSQEGHRANSGLAGTLLLRATKSDRMHFYGTSNETPLMNYPSSDAYRVPQTVYEIAPSLALAAPHQLTFVVGLPFKMVRMSHDAAGDSVRNMHLQGWHSRGQLGGQLGIVYGRDAAAERQRTSDAPGVRGDLVGTYYFGGQGLTGGYGTLEGSSAIQLGRPRGASPMVSIRAGGKKLWGSHPFDDVAFLGGRLGLPGVPEQEYAGDAAVFIVSEESVGIVGIAHPIRGVIGILGLEESGRVFAPGESSSKWHSAAGPGIWFAPSRTRGRLSVTYVRGEQQNRIYFRGGLGF
jgi:hypothetical protein